MQVKFVGSYNPNQFTSHTSFGSHEDALLMASTPRHVMQGRAYSSAAYRYGFNGKEKEADGTADNYDFGARIYDGRLGRWLAVDPKFKQFKSYSTYIHSLNIPIFFIDTDGGEIGPGLGPIAKITPALELCRKSTTFCNYLNKFVDINKGSNPNSVKESGSLSNITLQYEAIDCSNSSEAGSCQLFFSVKNKTTDEVTLVRIEDYTGDYKDINGITQSVRIGYNQGNEHQEVLLDQQAIQTETILHECLLHGEAQAALINDATVDGKVDYAALQKAYKAHYPTGDEGVDHDQLGTGSATLFNKGVEEVKAAIAAIPETPSYCMGSVIVDITYDKDGLPTSKKYGVVSSVETYTMSQRFTHYVEVDVKSHEPNKSDPKPGEFSRSVTVLPTTTTETKQVNCGSNGKQYSKPPVVKLPN